jgi:hypothetical protein
MDRLELYAEPLSGERPVIIAMERGAAIPGSINSHIYTAIAAADRPAEE